MFTLPTKKLEKIFNKKVIPNITCLGIDTASRTGWCLAYTTKKEVFFDYGFIDIKTTNKYFKYNRYIEIFSKMIEKNWIVIIEESFLQFNPKVFQFLSRAGAIIYTVAYLNGVKNISFLLASRARKGVGLKNAKKKIVHKVFLKKIKIKLKDPDIIDAMILSLNGIFENEKEKYL